MPFDLDLDTMMHEAVDAERKESGAAEGVPSTVAPPSVEAPEQAASPEPVAETPATEPPADGRVRGPDGKFIKADDKPDNNKIAADAKIGEPAKEPVSDQSVTAGIQTPVSWSPAAKAEFSKLPLVVQEAVAKREMEVSQGFKQYGEKVKQYEAIDKILDPLTPDLQRHGLTKDQYVQRLRAAEVALESNPVEGLKWLAKSYGVDLAQLATGQPQAEVAPEIQTLRTKLSELEQWKAQQEQARQQAFASETATAIEQFKSDPKNEFFEQVRPVMGQLVATGQAKDLAEAYDKACWLTPEVRQIMQARQADALQKKLREGSAAKVAQAAPAAGVKGNGTVNAMPTGDWADTLRDVTRAVVAG